MASPEARPRTRRLVAKLGNGLLTLAVLALSGAAIVFGVGFLTDRADAVPEPEAAAHIPVRVATVAMVDGYTVPRRFVGQIEARSDTSLSFELGGRMRELLVAEGDPVAAGQVIARLDTDLLNAERTRLEAARAATAAQLTYAEARLRRAMRLQGEGFTSRETLDQALAARDELSNRIAETDAALAAVTINLGKSVLTAPVSGRIAAQDVDAGATVQAGQTIVSLVETARPEFRVGLPLDLGPEALETAQIEVAGEIVPVALKRLRPDIDPVTRTRTAIFEVMAPVPALFGQTATLTLEIGVAAQGHWVPVDALQAGKGSAWSLHVLDGERLKRATVELMHVDGARAFVRGTIAPGDEIVLSGAHRVVPGQKVRALRGEG